MSQPHEFTINDRLILTVESASHLVASDFNGFSDPYVKIILNKYLEKKTKVSFEKFFLKTLTSMNDL